MNEVAVKPDLDGLRMVVEAVRNAPDDEFDMWDWDCGTTACAIGWFCRDNPTDPMRCVVDDEDSYLKVPGQMTRCSTGAIERRFGLTYEQAAFLFFPNRYDGGSPSRSAVIARIEQFIREHEAT